MLDRRKAIQNAIIGLGAISSPKGLYKLLTSDSQFRDSLESEVNNSESYWKLIKTQFKFSEGVLYFNNASLGSSPLSVINATEEYRRTLESFPSKYMWGGWKSQIAFVKEGAADLLNADIDEIALIHNTTEGMNVVASSLDLNPGDEVILGDHEHRTGISPWLYHQEKKGIKIVRPTLPVTPNDSQEIVEVYKKAITPKTKVISMVHITNTNGMILPIKEICSIARDRNILTLIDGAQSLGAIDCNVRDIGCDFFTASGHKWLFGPKGVGIFYAKKEQQKRLKPFIANYNYQKEDISKIDDYNTRNLPDVLGLGSAIDFHNMVGLSNMMKRTVSLRNRFLDSIQTSDQFIIKTPLDPSMSHHILTIEKRGAECLRSA
jgi:cysteine desulfurase/selenocysteine lyase